MAAILRPSHQVVRRVRPADARRHAVPRRPVPVPSGSVDVRFVWVDVFAQAPLTGNPLPLVPVGGRAGHGADGGGRARAQPVRDHLPRRADGPGGRRAAAVVHPGRGRGAGCGPQRHGRLDLARVHRRARPGAHRLRPADRRRRPAGDGRAPARRAGAGHDAAVGAALPRARDDPVALADGAVAGPRRPRGRRAGGVHRCRAPDGGGADAARRRRRGARRRPPAGRAGGRRRRGLLPVQHRGRATTGRTPTPGSSTRPSASSRTPRRAPPRGRWRPCWCGTAGVRPTAWSRSSRASRADDRAPCTSRWTAPG